MASVYVAWREPGSVRSKRGPGLSEGLLADAEAAARKRFGDGPVEEHPHLAAWREAFRAFGAKPQRTRPSAEALLRRVSAGLPGWTG